jgi:ketosteroid isomerase-like protein
MVPSQSQIELLEERRLRAMRRSDAEELDELLADDLVFTDHVGGMWSKQDDLEAHRSGTIEIDTQAAFDHRVRLLDGAAVVTVRLEISGTFAGHAASGTFRFTRVWAPMNDGQWRVAVAHSTRVADAAPLGADDVADSLA